MAAEKKTRGPRKKTNPPVPWLVPTPEGLSDLRREVRQLAEQRQLQCYRRVFGKMDEVIELLTMLTQPKPDRAEIYRTRLYFLNMELRGGKTPTEAFKNVVQKLKGTAFALGYGGLKKMYYRERDPEETWRRRELLDI
jgi:hypothetical protein